MIETIKELCALNGTSGREEKVREYIINKISEKCDISVDALGNVVAFKKGNKTPNNKVMIDAHMDEVGFIVTGITSGGLIHFGNVGGIDRKVIVGRECIVGEKCVKGVFGIKPIHLVDKEDELKIPPKDSLYIDIGAESREEALKYVSPGDNAYFLSDFIEFGDGFIKSKALDDRAGCAVLIDLINEEHEYDTYYSFSVQEEVGTRGAMATAFNVKPDFAIVVETTTAADISGSKDENRVCICGDGPAISFMDGGTVYDKRLYDMAFVVAREKNIKCQAKTRVAGGNNARTIHNSVGGIRTIAVSMPCRYLHSPSCVLKYSDVEETKKMIKAMAERMYND